MKKNTLTHIASGVALLCSQMVIAADIDSTITHVYSGQHFDHFNLSGHTIAAMYDDGSIGQVSAGTITAMYNSSSIDNMTGGTISAMSNSSSINNMTGGAVSAMYDSAHINTLSSGQIDHMDGSSTINNMTGGMVSAMYDSANINTLSSGQIDHMAGSSTINNMTGGTVSAMYDSAHINTLSSNGVIDNMMGGSSIDSMTGGKISVLHDGQIGNMSGGEIYFMNSGTVQNISAGVIYNMSGGSVGEITSTAKIGFTGNSATQTGATITGNVSNSAQLTMQASSTESRFVTIDVGSNTFDGILQMQGGTAKLVSGVLGSNHLFDMQSNTDNTLWVTTNYNDIRIQIAPTLAGVIDVDQNVSASLNELSGSNTTTLQKTGDGQLVLGQNRTFTSNVDIMQGILTIGESATSSSSVLHGDVYLQNATLNGYGIIAGNVIAGSGGQITPGSTTTGTLTAGGLTFQNGSSYQFKAYSDGSHDQIIVDSSVGGSGTAIIQTGATIDISGGAGIWQANQTYTLLVADNGVSGTFSTVNKDTPFLNYDIIYSSADIKLIPVRNHINFNTVGITYNQRSTANGIESLGAYNPLYQQIVSMNRQQAIHAFDNLSGEIFASVKSAALANSRYSRNAVIDHLQQNNMPTADTGRNLWLQTWYHDGHLQNDGNASRLENNGGGFLLGADFYQNNQTVIGAALGYETNHIKTDALRHSQADTNAIHLLVYGATALGPINIKAGAGYSWLDIDSTRHITLGAISTQNRADYKGHLWQAFVEGSRLFNITEITSLEPYAQLAYMRVNTNSIQENSSDYAASALRHYARSSSIGVSTLGIRSQVAIGTQGSTIYTDLGWQYTLGNTAPKADLSFSGGSYFDVKGTRLNRNAVQIGLGADIQLRPNMNLRFGYEGLLGNQSRDHAAKVQWLLQF